MEVCGILCSGDRAGRGNDVEAGPGSVTWGPSYGRAGVCRDAVSTQRCPNESSAVTSRSADIPYAPESADSLLFRIVIRSVHPQGLGIGITFTLLSSVTTITPFLTTHHPTVALGQQGTFAFLDSVASTRRFGLAKGPDAM